MVDYTRWLSGLSNEYGRKVKQAAYSLAFRTGAIEGVTTQPVQLDPTTLESLIVNTARTYANGLSRCGFVPPFAIAASLLQAKGATIKLASFPEEVRATDRDQYHFVESVLESVPTSNSDCGKALALTLHHLASLSGKAESPWFDSDGNYMLTN